MKIIMERAEGYAHECVWVELGSLKEASARLSLWARTAPEEGNGYHKCDIEVHPDDPELSFGFRHDLVRGYVDLEREATRHVEFYAGAWCPPHMEPERYQRYLDHYVPPERREHYKRILAALLRTQSKVA